MYEEIDKLIDALWSTMEPVGYVENKLHFLDDEKYLELDEKYGDKKPDDIIRQAKVTISRAIREFEEKIGQK